MRERGKRRGGRQPVRHQQRLDLLDKVRDAEGLGDDIVHAAPLGGGDLLVTHVGSDGDDGHVGFPGGLIGSSHGCGHNETTASTAADDKPLFLHTPDFAHACDAIHIGHLKVHEDDGERAVPRELYPET